MSKQKNDNCKKSSFVHHCPEQKTLFTTARYIRAAVKENVFPK